MTEFVSKGGSTGNRTQTHSKLNGHTNYHMFVCDDVTARVLE